MRDPDPVLDGVFAANEKRRNIFNGNGPKTKGKARKMLHLYVLLNSLSPVRSSFKFRLGPDKDRGATKRTLNDYPEVSPLKLDMTLLTSFGMETVHNFERE